MKPWVVLSLVAAMAWFLLKWLGTQQNDWSRVTCNGSIHFVSCNQQDYNNWIEIFPAVKCVRSTWQDALKHIWISGGYLVQGKLVPLLPPSEWMSPDSDSAVYIDSANNFFVYSRTSYNKFISYLMETKTDQFCYSVVTQVLKKWLFIDDFEIFLRHSPKKVVKLGVQVLKPVKKHGITFAMIGTKAVFAVGLQ